MVLTSLTTDGWWWCHWHHHQPSVVMCNSSISTLWLTSWGSTWDSIVGYYGCCSLCPIGETLCLESHPVFLLSLLSPFVFGLFIFFQFIITDKSKTRRGGGKVSVLWKTKIWGSTSLDLWMGTDHVICAWDRTGEGKRQRQVTYIRVVFSGRHVFSNVPIFYVICYILSSGGFDVSCFKTNGNGVPRVSIPWTDTYVFKCRQFDDLFHTLKTMEGLFHLVPPRTTWNSW